MVAGPGSDIIEAALARFDQLALTDLDDREAVRLGIEAFLHDGPEIDAQALVYLLQALDLLAVTVASLMTDDDSTNHAELVKRAKLTVVGQVSADATLSALEDPP